MPTLPQVKYSIFDRCVSALSPERGLTRMQNKFKLAALSDSGYIIPGSRKKSMKGVVARPNSPDADIVRKLDGMRGMSRDLFMNSPLAVSILSRKQVHDIGTGLKYQSRIDADFLELSDEERDYYQTQHEREFDLWSDSPEADFDGQLFFGEIQALGYLNMLLSGDFFWMPVWRPPRTPGFPYQFCIKLIDADLVRDPISGASRDRDIQGGVEYGKDGRLAGYHVWNTYPNDVAGKGLGSSVFVPAYDNTGRRQMYHVFDPKRIRQRRGVSELAPVVEPLKQMTRLSEGRVMTELIASLFTVFVRDQSGLGSYLPEALPPEETIGGGGAYGPEDSPVDKNLYDGWDLEMGHGNVVYLDDNKDVSVAAPRDVNGEFDKLWNALGIQVSAAGGMPFERAQMHYTTSYTAARAATLDAWLQTTVNRVLIERHLNKPVVTEWFTEALARDRIEAPSYYRDYAYQKAWERSHWVGSGQGSLNPLDEAKADAINLNNHLDTREDIYAQRKGGRWDQAMLRRSSENRLMERLELSDRPDSTELIGPDGQENIESETNTAD